MHVREDMHAYQVKMVDFIKEKPFCGLFAGMGSGKTCSTLTAVTDLFEDNQIKRVLVIAPKRVATDTWHKEIANWAHTKHLTYTILAGQSAAARKKAVFEDTQIHIINRENTQWLVDTLGLTWHYDAVVLDESHSFKSATAKRFKSLKKILHKVKRLLLLTGTPSNNGLLDLWAQIYLLDRGARLGRTMTMYKDRFFTSDYMGFNFTPKPWAKEKIYELIGDICMTLDVEDYLELPEKIVVPVEVKMPKKVRKQYEELQREFILELQSDTLAVTHAAALTTKLLQFCNGSVYVGEGKDRYTEHLHDAKLDALEEIVEGAVGEPVLVVYNFQSDVERIKAKFKNAITLDDDPDAIDKWNRGEIPMLLVHPASASTGLNLQSGGHIMAWFGLTWNLGDYLQMVARLHRQGQEKPVYIYHIICEGTVEQNVLKALADKNTSQRELLAALKRDLVFV